MWWQYFHVESHKVGLGQGRPLEMNSKYEFLKSKKPIAKAVTTCRQSTFSKQKLEFILCFCDFSNNSESKKVTKVRNPHH